MASLAYGEASSDFVGKAKKIEKERCREVRCAHERIEREEPSKIGLPRHMHLFDLTLTNEEQILALEQRAMFSSLKSVLLGGWRTADGQRSLYCNHRVLALSLTGFYCNRWGTSGTRQSRIRNATG